MRSLFFTLFIFTSILNCIAQEIPFHLVVYDKMNREPIAGATVKLQDLNSLREYKMTANDSGITNFQLAAKTRYRLEVSTKDDGTSTGYLSYTYMLSEKEVASKRTFEADLEKVKHTDSGLLPAMHFDYNSANLNTENFKSLDNVLTMMKSFATLQIEIGVYADCRENSLLVTKRVGAIADYLAVKGETKRVVVKEYGNVRSLNQCDCSNKNFICSEEKYTENRRAEFKVVAF